MKLKTENREYRSDVFSMLMEVRKNMTLDMTFEAREKMIRRDEFAAGRAEGKAEGQELLSKAIICVKNGMSLDEMIVEEIPEDTAKRAIELTKQLLQ